MPVRFTVETLIGTKARIAGLTLFVALAIPGCHRAAAAGQALGPDPADVNFAPVDGSGAPAPTYTPTSSQPPQVLAGRSVNEAQQQAEQYAQQGAPIERRAPDSSPYPQVDPNAPGADQGYYAPSPEDAEADAYAADLTAEASTEPPPELPEYEQPPCPDPDNLWTPGYWGWSPAGYYWVPGAWVAAPYTGALWTPGYWSLVGRSYRFHHGFWGPHIGFYGGINYGYGYTGYGYYGGYWRDRHFFYNTAVNRVNVNLVRNVYARNVAANNRGFNRVSYNGGRGGIDARPRPAELAVLREQRIPPMQSQLAVRREAAGNRSQFFSQNHGRPQMTTAARAIAADRSLPSALPRAAAAGTMRQNGNREAYRPGASQGGSNPGARGFSGQASPGMRNGQFDNRSLTPGQHPQSPGAVQPQGVVRPVQPNNIQHLPANQAQPDTNRQQYPPNRNDNYRRPYNQQQPQGQAPNTNFRRGNAPESQPPQQQQVPRPQSEPRQQPSPQFQQRQQPQSQQQPRPQFQQRQQQPAPPQNQPRQQPQFQQHQGPQPQNHGDHEERGR